MATMGKRTWAGETTEGRIAIGKTSKDPLATRLRQKINGINNTFVNEIVIKTLKEHEKVAITLPCNSTV
jgi:hypothetical protein